MNNLESLTAAMNRKEAEINRQQKYILEHGEKNDAGEFDKQWEQYEADAERNLQIWDEMKLKRDVLKASL